MAGLFVSFALLSWLRTQLPKLWRAFKVIAGLELLSSDGLWLSDRRGRRRLSQGRAHLE